jgi:hypothetical protein
MGGPLARQLHSLWVQHWPQHPATVEVIGVRYPDDAVLGFQAAWLLDSDGSSKVLAFLSLRTPFFASEGPLCEYATAR